VLLIPGFAADRYTWRHVVPRLSAFRKCYAIDLPGVGRSDAFESFQYSLESLSDLLANFAKVAGLQNCIVVAHSLGASIAMMAMIRSPEFASNVSGLCVLDGACYPQRLPFFISLLRVPYLGEWIAGLIPVSIQVSMVLNYCYSNKARITHDQIAHYSGLVGSRRVRAALQAIARSIDLRQLAEYSARISEVEVPSLLIWGAKDRVVPLKYGRRLKSNLRGSRLFCIEDCGHIPQEECPERLCDLLLQWAQHDCS